MICNQTMYLGGKIDTHIKNIIIGMERKLLYY